MQLVVQWKHFFWLLEHSSHAEPDSETFHLARVADLDPDLQREDQQQEILTR